MKAGLRVCTAACTVCLVVQWRLLMQVTDTHLWGNMAYSDAELDSRIGQRHKEWLTSLSGAQREATRWRRAKAREMDGKDVQQQSSFPNSTRDRHTHARTLSDKKDGLGQTEAMDVCHAGACALLRSASCASDDSRRQCRGSDAIVDGKDMLLVR